MNKLSLITTAGIFIILLASCGGNTSSSNQPAAKLSGEDIYKKTCITCHLPKGEGLPGTFPPLAKSDFLANRESVIKQVLKGNIGEQVVNGTKYNSVMPAQPLGDEEVALVLTYVYSNFGNSGAPVTAAEVKALRSKL